MANTPTEEDIRDEGERRAFPSTHSLPVFQGLNLREYYAAAALQGLISTYPHSGDVATIESRRHALAMTAFSIADAMVARGLQ